MKKYFFLILILSLIAAIAQPAFAFRLAKDEVLVLEGTPLSIKPLAPPASADAVENIQDMTGLREIVRFQVTRILQGTLSPAQKPKERSFRELFTKNSASEKFDWSSAPKDMEDLRFRIAVTSAKNVFDLSPEDLDHSRYRIYCKRYNNEETTFVLTRFEKISRR